MAAPDPANRQDAREVRVLRVDTRDGAGSDPIVDAHVPVLVVGAGACGLVTALRVAEAGIETLLVERDASTGGSTALSSGFVPAAGTRMQQSAGVHDSPEEFAEDIQAKAHHSASPALVHAYAHAAASAIDWLAERHRLPFEVLDGFLYPGHRVRRMHAMPERTGRSLVDRLARAAEAVGIDTLYRARAFELVVDVHDRVRAVRLAHPDGGTTLVGCDVLVLACNGYGGDPALRARWLPEFAQAVFAGHVGNDGTAVRWGEALGATLADMGACQGHGSWATPHDVLVSWALMMRGAIQIDRTGRRFHDETVGYSEAAVAVLGCPDGIAWNVFDAPLAHFAQEFPDFREAAAAGAVRCADDLPALAALIGCEQSALAATFDEMRASVRDGTTDRFGRRLARVLEPPFYAVRVTGALFHTQGGLDVDAQMRVLRTDGRAFPNLLAAGGAARGVSGNAVSGYLSGNGLLSAIAGGWLAGATAAASVRRS